MQAADLRDLDYATSIDGMSFPSLRAIHVKRLVNSPFMVVAEVLSQDSLEVALVSHDRGTLYEWSR